LNNDLKDLLPAVNPLISKKHSIVDDDKQAVAMNVQAEKQN
jgi:hypothetical protein